MISDLERVQALDAILDEAEKIRLNGAVRATLPEIDDRFCVGSSFVLMYPTGEDGSMTNFVTIKKYFRGVPGVIEYKFYLAHPEDSKWQEAEKKWDGMYQSEHHTLGLKLEPGETYRCMAFKLIHEWGHMLRAAQEGRTLKENIQGQKKIFEEVDMRTFDYKLLLAIGGPAYKEKAEKVVYQISRWRSGKYKNPPSDTDFATALDPCFGPATTPEARKKREVYFKSYCDLMATDLYLSPEKALAAKCRMIAFQEEQL